MGSLDPIPYWHYNVPEAERTPECPAFLLNLSDKDRRIVGSLDSSFSRLTWPEVRALITANELERFQRIPSQLRRYRSYAHRQAALYGSVAAFVLAERLRWQEPIVARGLPFQHPDDVRIIFNDWPYGLDKRIVHLVVWTKFELESDPVSGDLTDETRAAIDSYVAKTFRSRVAADNVAWFKNWSALKSIHAVEHFHVMLFDPDPAFIRDVTNGDVPQCDILMCNDS
ncbi:hypothetical protein JDV02_001464 [Purpureocillium takamizusanense]|uniref:N-acetylglucosamine-induced protein 1 n=1 Tax=Purpureocillium takamizusanense TaxID=2060973 RepID=A0A9Q8V6M9_9HYPO|nr:uncharacterized protein JDV02_001464 [Purpureocillium takamizusanense]UNI14883.1 hypothetical protein JDV02_001464 [Purpureocillium takamizusanense]